MRSALRRSTCSVVVEFVGPGSSWARSKLVPDATLARRFCSVELTILLETIERHVREQLSSLLGEGGFDPARDIVGITVNRWAHGYAYSYNSLVDPLYDDDDDERYPHVQARKPFGRITIANADAGANAMMEEAIDQAYRAVNELTS